jgi:hypothetical protein
MSFLRHDEIYRSDVVWALRRGSASASPCWGQSVGVAVMLDANGEKANGERNRSHAPRSSSAMRLGSAIPWRVALQQGPPPLYRPESMLHPPAETVNHHLLGAGEFSTGEMGNFQPALTVGLFCCLRLSCYRDSGFLLGGCPRKVIGLASGGLWNWLGIWLRGLDLNHCIGSISR